MRSLSAPAIVFLLAGATLAPAAAQISVDSTPRRPFLSAVSLESVRATVRIVDGTATTEIEQVFRNHGPTPVEEDYLFPLPEDSVASDLSLAIDGRTVKGELLDRDRARAIYEEIVRGRRDPALLEWVGKACVRVQAFPVPPNGEAKVTLRFASLLPSTAGAFEYRLPLNLAPIARRGLRSFVLDATVESARALAAIYSPTHAVDVRREGEKRARVTMESAGLFPDRDLRLLVASADREFGFVFLPHRRPGEEGTFLALFAPRFDLDASRLQPKELIVVMDTSGSMAGEKIQQAKGALRHVLGRLGPSDRFNLVRFSTDTEAFRESPVEPTAENLAAARAWIERIEARGGTDIDGALARALSMPRSEGRLPLLFFVTDGLPTVGNTDEKGILAAVRARNGGKSRIFVFGVGNDVNTRLLDTIAEETRAAREYVRASEDIEVKVSGLVDKVSSPVLSDVSVAFDGAEAHDLYPRPTAMPDVFKGSQLVVFGRYRGEGRKTIRLAGRFGDARREWAYEVDFPRIEDRNDTVRALWAARKVNFLLDDIRMLGANPELVEEVRRLGREHGIVTPYTSFLVVEEGQRLAAARGLGGGAFRFADLDGDGRADLPGPGTGGIAGSPGDSVPALEDAFVGLVARAERKDADETLERLRRLGEATSGEGAVLDSAEVFRAKVSAAPAPALRPSRGAISELAADGREQSGRSEAFVRRVGAKVFHLVGSGWIDAAFTEKDRDRVTVVPFLSAEYFALLAREPGIAASLALGDRVVVEWKGTLYEVR